MKLLLHRMNTDRSSAIALIFALSIVPLVLMVALSVDYAFYVQSRAQASLAADAAATHAVRAADAVYTYELSINDPTAVADAETAGSAIGKNWFAAALGNMTKASITNNLNNPTITLAQNTNGSAGFTATVNFAGTYPPFFKTLFSNKLWNINGGSQAQSSFSYVEILMLLDNSSSMLIASSDAGITQLEELTACPTSGIASNFEGNAWGDQYYQQVNLSGGDPQDVLPETLIKHYTPASTAPTYIGTFLSATGYGYAPGKCDAGWTGNNGTNQYNPYAPCAFACHTTTTTLQTPTVSSQGAITYTAVPGYTDDYYGIARHNGIELRLDVVQSAASAVVTAMQTNEQASGQFTVGIYEFNDDVIPVWPAPGCTQSCEASTDLAGAAKAIQTTAPPVQANAQVGNTNFYGSINDFIGGTYLNNIAYRPNAPNTTSPALTTAVGNTGTTSTTPQKDVFIVTDGMDDTSAYGPRIFGEMTGYYAEHGTNLQYTPKLCGKLKDLNYTVYVLYIDYIPLANRFYQTSTVSATQYGLQDYSGIGNGPTKDYAESTAGSVGYPPDPSLSADSPDQAGLIGCATSPSDFFEATSDSEIGTAMNSMLHAALTSTIQLTQ